jgi:hypothetical protein
MAEEDDYRRHAAELVRLAKSAPTPADKGRLLGLAAAWLDLADRAKALANRYRRRLVRILPLKDSEEIATRPD